MHITFSPCGGMPPITLAREGDTLIINGEVVDFSGLADGGVLPAEDVSSTHLVGDVRRKDGVLHLTLILPHGPNAPEETRFPAPITVEDDGPVEIPPYDAPQEGAGA